MDEQQSTAQHTGQHTGQHGPGCFFCSVAAPQIKAFMDQMWPKNTREHFRNARIEMLKGMRSILDARIDSMSKHEARGAKVTVE